MHGQGQLFGYEVPIPLALGLIGIEGMVHRRHDHRQLVGRGVALYAGAPHPDGVVVGIPVQQIKHLGRLPPCAGLHADAGLLLGQDHPYRDLHL